MLKEYWGLAASPRQFYGKFKFKFNLYFTSYVMFTMENNKRRKQWRGDLTEQTPRLRIRGPLGDVLRLISNMQWYRR